jgi:hypothetical protein
MTLRWTAVKGSDIMKMSPSDCASAAIALSISLSL